MGGLQTQIRRSPHGRSDDKTVAIIECLADCLERSLAGLVDANSFYRSTPDVRVGGLGQLDERCQCGSVRILRERLDGSPCLGARLLGSHPKVCDWRVVRDRHAVPGWWSKPVMCKSG